MASSEEPLYLTVGTDVSAKYRGAFCEAKIKKVQRMVKCRVTFKNNLGTHLVPDDHIRGALRVGAHVEAKHPDKNHFLEAVIGKLLDYSQYTVVFDDGDETTLRRTSLCLKSGRHFAESETLDQLPLTNPEHFGTPVMGSKSKRKRRSATSASLPLEEESSEEEASSPPMLQQRSSRGSGLGSPLAVVGRVVCLEGDRRKRDSWLPVLVVSPGQEGMPTGRDECLVRSFRDGKYFQVTKCHLRQFIREGVPQRAESGALRVALERARAYLDRGELPAHWDPQLLLGGEGATAGVKDEDDGDDDEGVEDVSDDEPSEEKDRFVAQLYKFMDERGTPINKGPAINGRDLNLYRLFRLVGQLGGGNRVSNQNQWRRVYSRLALPPPASQSNAHLLRNAYKKYLQSFEDFYRKLGCTMESHPRGGVSGRGGRVGRSPRHRRVLTRNQDRGLALFALPVKEARRPREEVRREKGVSEHAVTRRGGSEPVPALPCGAQTQQTDQKAEQTRPRATASRETPPPVTSAKRQWRRTKPDEGAERADEDSSNGGEGGSGSSSTTGAQDGGSEGEGAAPRPSRGPLEVGVGDRVRVKYGRGRQLKVYEAKVLRIEDEGPDRRFYVHYTGWNMRYDEWVRKNRIVENVTDKSGRRKRMHKNAPDTPPGGSKRAGASRGVSRRGRPPGTARGSLSARPASAGSGGVRGRRRSGALGYESGGVSDESSLQADAASTPTPREEDLLTTPREDLEDDAEGPRSGASTPGSPSRPQGPDEVSPTPGSGGSMHDVLQEESGDKDDEKEKQEEDEDTDIDEGASAAQPRAAGEDDEEGGPEEDPREEEGQCRVELEEPKEEEEDSLSGNLFIYEESSTAEELDLEKDEGSPEEPSHEVLVPEEKVEEAKEEVMEPEMQEEEERKEEVPHWDGGVAEVAQSSDVQDRPEPVPEVAADFAEEVDIKEEEPLICEEVVQESNSEVEAETECKAEVEKEEEETREEEGGAEEKEPSLPAAETTVESTNASAEGPEPEVEELLYEEVDEVVEMEGEAAAKTVQELVESALEALETTEAEDAALEGSMPFQDFGYALEVRKEEEEVVVQAERAPEEELPTAKVKQKSPKEKKEGGAGQKKLRRSRKLQCGAERKQFSAVEGPFPKRRKVAPRRRALGREEASGSGVEPAGVQNHEQNDFLSTLAEVCSGRESSLKEQPAAESADALFLLCEEKVPASPLHSAAELSVPVLENTPPTTPDDSEATSSEASPHRGNGGAGGEASASTAAFLDAESTVSAEGDSENSRGLADLKGEGEDSSSSRTTDSADAAPPKAGVAKRPASAGAPPDAEEGDGAGPAPSSSPSARAAAGGTKRTRKVSAVRTPPRCDSGTTKTRQPRSVLRTRDMFVGSSLENTESGLRRPSKFHFDAPLDKDMDPEQRIAVLQERLTELRKVYVALKAEVALIDRRRKHAKKKDGGAPGMPDVCVQPDAQCCS